MIMIFYGAIKVTNLYSFGESDVMASTRDSHYNMNFVFPDDIETNEHGKFITKFDLAFGLTGVDGQYLNDTDPRYGMLKARYVQWGLEAGGMKIRYNDSG